MRIELADMRSEFTAAVELERQLKELEKRSKPDPHKSAFEKIPPKVPEAKTAIIGDCKSYAYSVPGAT